MSSGAAGQVSDRDRLAATLLQTVDAGLAGCIFVVPMIMGGREAAGRLVLVVLALVVALAWAGRHCLRAQGTWRRSAAEWLILAGVVLLILQLVPLPSALLAWVAPNTAEILPLWNRGDDSSLTIGTWSQVSLTPAATQAALVIFIAYSLLFLVTVQRIKAVEDVERLLRWCALSVVLMASFGLAQFLFGNGRFFWVYEHPFSDTEGAAKGAFTNRNHFAHFLALGIGPLIWWVQRSLGQRRKNSAPSFAKSSNQANEDLITGVQITALAIVLLAVLLSLSRGGAVAALLATVICVLACYRASSMGPKFMVGLTGAALLIAVSMTIVGYDRVSKRLDDLTSGSLESLDQTQARRTIWETVAKAIPDYAQLGAGVGSHREVYPMYLEWTDSNKYYSHSECGYLQVTLEAGMLGLALLLTGAGICGFWCIDGMRIAPNGRTLVCMGAVSASLLASAAHSAVDFVWYIPGCMAMVVVLMACACRLWQLSAKEAGKAPRQITLSRNAGLTVLVLLLATGAWMLNSWVGKAVAGRYWNRFLTLDHNSPDLLPFGESQMEDTAEDEEAQALLATRQRAVDELNSVVRWDPTHARAHLRLAEAYVRLFHHVQQNSANVMSLNQIRDAVIQSRSESVPPEQRLSSRKALEEWLSRAIGDHYRYLDLALQHSRDALKLCPLLGEGYLFLSELCFLEGGQTSSKTAYVAQALKVRPFDGTVLFHAGNEAVLAGNPEEGLAYWRKSFAAGLVHQKQIVDWLVGRIQPGDLEEETRFFIETFQPDLEGLRLLDDRYEQIALAEQMAPLRTVYAQAVEAEAQKLKNAEAARLWLEAMTIHEKQNLPEQSLRCARKALDCDPNKLHVRQRLAYCLFDAGLLDEAEEHLDWCLKRKPDSQALRNKLREVDRRRNDSDGLYLR